MTLTLLEDKYCDAESGYHYSHLSAVDMETGEVISSQDSYSKTLHYDELHGAQRGVFIMLLQSQNYEMERLDD